MVIGAGYEHCKKEIEIKGYNTGMRNYTNQSKSSVNRVFWYPFMEYVFTKEVTSEQSGKRIM